MDMQEYVERLSPGDGMTAQVMRRILLEALEGWEEELRRQGRLIHEPDIASDALSAGRD